MKKLLQIIVLAGILTSSLAVAAMPPMPNGCTLLPGAKVVYGHSFQTLYNGKTKQWVTPDSVYGVKIGQRIAYSKCEPNALGGYMAMPVHRAPDGRFIR